MAEPTAAPTERQVDRAVLWSGSSEMAEAIEPYGMFTNE